MDIQLIVKTAKDLTHSINKVNTPADKLHFIELNSLVTGVSKQHIMEKSFETVLDDFAEYVHKKRNYLKVLEAEMGKDFEADGKEWSKIKQFKALEKEVQMLNLIAVFINQMEEILRGEIQEREYDFIQLWQERETYRLEAAHNWTLFKSAANSEHILLKSLLKQTEKAVNV